MKAEAIFKNKALFRAFYLFCGRRLTKIRIFGTYISFSFFENPIRR